MKILNLVNQDKSDIEYKIDSFPDGQSQVKITNTFHVNYHNESPVLIKARLNNFRDLELIICTTKSLRALGIKEIHLYAPYFLGSRSDRKFEIGSNNYLRDVICPIINSLGFESVTVMDPHSDVLEACLNNFRKEDNCKFVKWALEQVNNKNNAQDTTVFVSPDGGALKKIYKAADYVHFKGTIITCSKSRDEKGNLSRVNVPLSNLVGKDLVIIDDICDGGATFINIAEEIRKHYTNEECKIYLVVTHGIFSKGFTELNKYFDGIYCTDSYRGYIIKDAATPRLEEFLKDQYSKLKQLNIF